MKSTAKQLYDIHLKEEGWRERFADELQRIQIDHTDYSGDGYNQLCKKEVEIIIKLVQSEMNNLLDRVEDMIGDSLPSDFGIGNITVNGKTYLMEINDPRIEILNEFQEEQRKKLKELRKELS